MVLTLSFFYLTLGKIITSIQQLQPLQTSVITPITAQLPLFFTSILPNLETFHLAILPTLFNQFPIALIAGTFFILILLFSLFISAKTITERFGAVPALLDLTLASTILIADVCARLSPNASYFVVSALNPMLLVNTRDNRTIVACDVCGGKSS